MTARCKFPVKRKEAIRPRKLTLALLAAAACLGPLAAWAQTQIYDSKTHTWVDYDKKKARQY
jgi:hypothetical protein